MHKYVYVIYIQFVISHIYCVYKQYISHIIYITYIICDIYVYM